MWDYNAYHRPSEGSRTGLRDDENDSYSLLMAQQDDAEGWADVTNLPNRAYARQRGFDYVRFKRLDFMFHHPSTYDFIAFFPPSAIMIHLDHSLHELLPTADQFMTVGNTTGFFVLNLRHAAAAHAISNWQTLLQDDDDIDNDVSSFGLSSFLLSNLPQSLPVSFLPEHDGFVGNRLIQCLPATSSAAVADDVQRKNEAATTVASVCYRYYPKCEVL